MNDIGSDERVRIIRTLAEKLAKVEPFIKAVQEETDQYKEVVSTCVDMGLQFGPEIRKIFEAVADGFVDIRMRTFARYQEKGLNREEAMLFMLRDAERMWPHINKYMKNIERMRKS